MLWLRLELVTFLVQRSSVITPDEDQVVADLRVAEVEVEAEVEAGVKVEAGAGVEADAEVEVRGEVSRGTTRGKQRQS